MSVLTWSLIHRLTDAFCPSHTYIRGPVTLRVSRLYAGSPAPHIYCCPLVWIAESRYITIYIHYTHILNIYFIYDLQLWEVYNERRCVRTYYGHRQAVRDINFNNCGKQFLSAGNIDLLLLLLDCIFIACCIMFYSVWPIYQVMGHWNRPGDITVYKPQNSLLCQI